MKDIRIARPIDSYKSFFDHGWATSLDSLVDGTKLVGPVFSLCMNWKAAANTHAFPWVMTAMLKNFAKGTSIGHGSAADWAIFHLVKEIPVAMAPHLTNMQRKKLAAGVKSIGEQWKAAVDQDKEEASQQELFEQFLLGPGGTELQLSVWGSQRIVYGAVFHAYEDFMTQCVGLVRSEPDYRGYPFPKLVADARTAFGNETADYCLTDTIVKVSHLVRNALDHNGGRPDERLGKIAHGIEILDGELQITPLENRKLFDELKVRVDRVAAAALSLPGIR